MPAGMKLPAPPNVSEKDFESFPKWVGDLFTTRRFSVEILNAVVDRQEAEITRLLTRDIEREKEMIVLRERNSKWET